MKDSEKVSEWFGVLLGALGTACPNFDFLAADLVARHQKRDAATHIFDLTRKRTDGLYDRVYLDFEYFNPKDKAELEPLGFSEFGWFLGFQYAINQHSSCEIPCIVNGFYCNLSDLVEFSPEHESLLAEDGENFHLGENEEQFGIMLLDLASFLAVSMPLFCKAAIADYIKPQQGGVE